MIEAGLHNFQVLRGLTSANSLLSGATNGSVSLSSEDGKAGELQGWDLVPVADFPGVYNIRVQGGTEPKYTYLSCTSDGETVNLIAEDDLSGRQRWRFVPADSPICEYYQIIVVGGTSGGRVYLSCTSDGKQVNLIKDDDGSGRQRWQAQKIQT
ncbi:RICIN domain-containing protein [Bradyrhizobium sp. HKCCYLRH2060]|uniref:hypothetical protein n=1 Tax=Bradyrhizobium TaxID=374 RepID=UPI002916081F|nr:hypothetical protein [Bradyrhizobium sp. SZCCHNR3003]